MTRRARPTSVLLLLAVAATLAVVAAACGGDDGAATPTTAPGHTDHGADDPYGTHSGMAPEVTTVAELASLGPGPAVGETFSGHLGLNVCGRFLTPPPATSDADTGISTDGSGAFTITPPSGAVAGARATIGSVAAQVGVELHTGSVGFPATTDPALVEIGPTSVQVAGRTLGEDVTCAGTPTEVQLWVYTADAVRTGESVRSVVVDPQDAPVVEDGMAFVIAVTPDSSLPTLPPSAIQG